MNSRDLASALVPAEAIKPGTYLTGTNAAGAAIDNAGFESLTLVLTCGAVTDAQTLTLQKSSNNSDYVDVVAADCVGGADELAAFKAIADDDDDAVKILGLVGTPRYIKVSCTGDGVTGATFGVVALKGHPQFRPVYDIK